MSLDELVIHAENLKAFGIVMFNKSKIETDTSTFSIPLLISTTIDMVNSESLNNSKGLFMDTKGIGTSHSAIRVMSNDHSFVTMSILSVFLRMRFLVFLMIFQSFFSMIPPIFSLLGFEFLFVSLVILFTLTKFIRFIGVGHKGLKVLQLFKPSFPHFYESLITLMERDKV
jgi:hypothetical protein